MRRLRAAALLAFVVSLVLAHGAYSYDCPYSLDTTTRITVSRGKSQTARNNARCICTDPGGTVHMVWEDTRNGNYEVYYASMAGDSVLQETRITRSRGESVYPCVACDSQNVYILWQESAGEVNDVFYVRMRGGTEVARTRITRSPLNSACPVSVPGPDNSLHIAWHEGPFKQTAVYYGKIVDDSLVVRQQISTQDPEAFRPDIACDTQGRVLIAWFEGFDVKSRLWNGTSWGEEKLVATNKSRPWRLSAASLPENRWALAWFDKTEEGSDVLVKFYDGEAWYGQTKISLRRGAYYPSLTSLGGGNLAAVWERNDPNKEEYLLVVRCYNGKDWSTPLEIYKESVAGRYASLAPHKDQLHAVWFSGKAASNEIYHGLLRRK